ncbi:3624_t:CDS:2 [Funneliformis geosporum]|uniref:6617_t:CDS:1 n=1 Tax=Funneliformis geosporum TaxID=1117311 RepID=A0A9W4WV91_9GLOM|nr:6617_t:CDS:2 [Funneliformis geosporum]CAI2193281.1 3624_t:CDS:2 [Funneliformis geosporum]
MPHSSGSWILLREAIQKSFEKLETSDFYFVAKTNSEEDKIEDEFKCNKLGKKAYGDWTFKEVFKGIYNNTFNSISLMPTFEIEEVEVKLDGNCGYSVLDYDVYMQKITVLVTEAKPHESEKAVIQTLVQIHSVTELLLSKRK